MNTDLSFAIGLPPEEAIRYFEGKGLKLTGDWRELWQEQHAKAFTVARLAKLDVLKDIHDALNDALKNGTTERQFVKDMTPLLQKKGWWGPAVDKQTGEVLETYDDISGRPVEWGSPRRLKLIYRQNMQTAYMAGRYKQQQELANATGPGARPYWQYIAVRDSRTRPTHSALHGRVWRADDPIWNHLYPPNGWNCRCRVRALSEFRMKKEGLQAESSDGQLVTMQVSAGKLPNGKPDLREVTGIRILDRDGKPAVMLPDAGWSYNPGRAWYDPFLPAPLDGPPDTRPLLPGIACLTRSCPGGAPEPRPFPRERLLPTGKSDEWYVAAFLAEFGASLDKHALYEDVTSETLVIARELFVHPGTGRLKVQKRGREVFLPLLADTIKDPDIKLQSIDWHHAARKVVLRNRYLASWHIEGNASPAIAVFEWGTLGWYGITAYQRDAGVTYAEMLAQEASRSVVKYERGSDPKE
ncbi:MAG: phage minor head protein [Pseudomonadota bacterium]